MQTDGDVLYLWNKTTNISITTSDNVVFLKLRIILIKVEMNT